MSFPLTIDLNSDTYIFSLDISTTTTTKNDIWKEFQETKKKTSSKRGFRALRVIGLGVFFTKQNDIISKRNVNEVLMNIGNKSKAKSFSIKEISCLFCVCVEMIFYFRRKCRLLLDGEMFSLLYTYV